MIEVNNKTRQKIDISLIKQVTARFLKQYNKQKFDVSIAFVSDQTIRRLNYQYRKINKTTDVLAFPGEENFLGEIIINCIQVKRQARKFSNSYEQELVYILVHGLLHLLGYNDTTEKERLKMEELAKKYIKNYK